MYARKQQWIVTNSHAGLIPCLDFPGLEINRAAPQELSLPNRLVLLFSRSHPLLLRPPGSAEERAELRLKDVAVEEKVVPHIELKRTLRVAVGPRLMGGCAAENPQRMKQLRAILGECAFGLAVNRGVSSSQATAVMLSAANVQELGSTIALRAQRAARGSARL